MNRRITVVSLGMSLALLLAACNQSQKPATASSNAAPATQPAPAPPANATANAATAQPSNAPAADPNAAVVEQNQKLAAIDWAMKQAEIKHDPNGQWPTSATASSSYNNAKDTQPWSATQATGEPNVERYGDDGRAWAPSTQNGGIE